VGSAASAEARAINLDGSLSLLRMAIDAGVRRFVFLSSTLSSDQSIQYGRDKHAVEEALLAAAAAGSIEVVILRAVNIYGVGMRGNIAAMIRLISSGVLPRLPKLTNRLSLVGVDDVVSALLLAATLDSPADPSALMAKFAIRVTLTDGCTYEINAIEKSIYDTVERSPSHWRLPACVTIRGLGDGRNFLKNCEFFAAVSGCALTEILRATICSTTIRRKPNLASNQAPRFLRRSIS
jgi:nucleoside-diphosphate-sugar epimerase